MFFLGRFFGLGLGFRGLGFRVFLGFRVNLRACGLGFKGFVGLFGPFGIKSLGLRALLVLFRLIQGVRALKISGLGGLGFRVCFFSV